MQSVHKEIFDWCQFHYCPLAVLLGSIYWREGMIKGRSLTGAPNSPSVGFLSKLTYMDGKLGDWCMELCQDDWKLNRTLLSTWNSSWKSREKSHCNGFIASCLFCFVVAYFAFFRLVFHVIFVVWSKSPRLMRVTLNIFILPWLSICNIQNNTADIPVCIREPSKWCVVVFRWK